MNMIPILLVKDLKRTIHNPVPFLITIAIPFLITLMIGMAFGPMSGGDGEGMAPIRLGVVDEDDSLFSHFLSGTTGQEDFQKHIDMQFLEREQAMEMIGKGKLSAVLIIPENFTEDYLEGKEKVKLTLIKNPAESIYPTLAQEGTELVVTTLNAIARNFREDLQALEDVFDEDQDFSLLRDGGKILMVVDRSLKRLEAAEDYLAPPLVGYEKEDRQEEEAEESGPDFNLFAFLLIGMSAMFLLMLADNCMRDLYRENRFHTLERFRTLHEGLFPFVASKVLYTIVILMVAVVVLFGGGSLIFQFTWQNLGKVLLLVISYNLFGAGLMGLLAALAGRERRADILNNIVVMGIALVGGAMWPPEQLPPFIRDHITPYSPAFWFSSAVRGLQSDYAEFDWILAIGLLTGLGLVFIALAARIFQIRLGKGVRDS